MQAVVVEDGAVRLEGRPDPVPGDTELLVSVRAAGINGADLIQRRGHYPAPAGVPADIPGLELAGEVAALGRRVSGFSVGDRVMAVVGGGGQATMATVDQTHALRVPDRISWAEAGGFPEVFSTAWDALWPQCGLAPGDRLLVTGAAGGVGTAAVQLGAATGAVVVGSVRTPESRDAVEQLGADVVVDPAEVGDHGPYDVVLELVGAASLPAALAALEVGGRVSVIGVGSGGRMEIDLLHLMGRRARISGSTLRPRNLVDKAAVAAGVRAHVLPLLDRGRIVVPVAATFPLADATAAYDRFAAGGKIGKIVLVA